MPDALSDEALTQPTLSLLIFEADFNRHRPFSYGVWHVKLLLWFPSRVARAGCILRRCGADSHGIPARCSAHSHLRRLCGRAAPLALPAARDARVRPGFNLSILECGSPASRASQRKWSPARARSGRSNARLLGSISNRNGVRAARARRSHLLQFPPHQNTARARLMAGHLPWHLRGTLGSRGCWLLHKVTLRIAQSSPSMNVHVRHVNSPYTKEHRPSINVSQNVLLRIRSKIS